MSEKKNGISIANILAMLGLAGLGVLSFFGLFFQSPDGNLSKPVLLAAGIVAAFAILLIIMVRAKGANDNPDKWRFVEWGALAIYLVLAWFAAKPALHFFYVVSEKENLQQMAREDVDAMDNLYATYNKQKKEAVDLAVEQFENYLQHPQYIDHKPVAENDKSDYLYYFAKKYFGGNTDEIERWIDDNDSLLEDMKDSRTKELRGSIAKWDLMKLPLLSLDLSKAKDAAWKRVEDRIATNQTYELIPVVNGGASVVTGEDKPFEWGGLATFNLPEKQPSSFADSLKNGKPTALGWVIYIVLHLLILLDYLLARRSSFVGPSKNTPSNGLDL